MTGSTTFVEQMIEQKLLDLHCGYIGQVLETDGHTATVQPLGLIKETGSSSAKTQAIVKNVPVACRYRFAIEQITYVVDVEGTKRSKKVAVPVEIAPGDIVACLCADRDIADARRGSNELPPAGNHSISDSIIVGILEIGEPVAKEG